MEKNLPPTLEAILGSSYEGVLSSDDFSAHNGYTVKAQQKCQAHLRRHFKKLIKLPGLNNKEIGSIFLSLIDEGFTNYALLQQTQNIDEFRSLEVGHPSLNRKLNLLLFIHELTKLEGKPVNFHAA